MNAFSIVFEPYCWFQPAGTSLLVYNELTACFYSYSFSRNVLNEDYDSNKHAIRINTEYRYNKEIIDMIYDLESNFCISGIYSSSSMEHMLCIKRQSLFENFPLHYSNKDATEMVIKKVLRSIIIYPDGKEESEYTYHKQMIHPYVGFKDQEIDYKVLQRFLKTLPYSTSTKFIIAANTLESLMRTIQVLELENIVSKNIDIVVKNSLYKSLDNRIKNLFNYKVFFDIDELEYQESNPSCKSSMVIVANVKKLADVKKTDKSKLLNIKPFFVKNNPEFYEQFYFSKNDIEQRKISINQITKNVRYNSYLYGLIHIDPAGSVYESLNSNKAGSIYEDAKKNLNEIWTPSGAWFETRESVTPCKKCEYRFFCPPISEYERNLGKFNFCEIRS